MKFSWRFIVIVFVLGCVLGAGSVAGLWIHFGSPRSIAPDRVKIVQESGEKITHKDFSVSRRALTFCTEAEGRGVIRTEIPVTLIPQANAWINRVHGIEASVFLLYQSQQLYHYYSLTYWYRFGPFALGAGTIFSFPMSSYGIMESPGSVGVKVGMMGWF